MRVLLKANRQVPVCFALALLALIQGGCALWEDDDAREWDVVPLTVTAILLPGVTAAGEPATLRFVWAGGGCLRRVHAVGIDTGPGVVDLEAWGLVCRNCLCPCDAFQAVHAVALPPLVEGTHAIRMSTAYRCENETNAAILVDTLSVPSSGTPGVFTFDVRVWDPCVGGPCYRADVQIGLFEEGYLSPDTSLVGTTDLSGRCRLQYEAGESDSLTYALGIDGDPWEVSRWMTAVRGVPERIAYAHRCFLEMEAPIEQAARSGSEHHHRRAGP